MSNIIEFNPRKTEEPESVPKDIEIDFDPDDIEFMIDVLTEFAETGEMTGSDIEYAFMCMADLIVQIHPEIVADLEEEPE